MIGITPNSVYPLKYPKGDPSIPSMGAFAVSVELNMALSTEYDVNLLQVQQQNNFGSLRSIWIDASLLGVPLTVAVNGTEQVFTVPANTANYYAVINLNVPVVTFTIGAETAAIVRVLFLNFVPSIGMQGQLSLTGDITVSGSVSVTNFPAVQNVNVENFPATQPVSGTVAVNNLPATQNVAQSGTWNINAIQSGAWSVAISNFPATQPVSGSVSVSNFPASQAVTGAFFQATQPVSIAGNVITAPQCQSTGIASIVFGAAGTKTYGAAANNFLTQLSISLISLINPGTVAVSIQDGSGNVLYSYNIGASGTAVTIYNYIAFYECAIPLSNGTNAPKIVVTGTFTSGDLLINVGYH